MNPQNPDEDKHCGPSDLIFLTALKCDLQLSIFYSVTERQKMLSIQNK